MPYKNKDIQKEYQRNLLKNKRNRWIIENGPCKICGYSYDLEIDHIDPSTKIKISWSWRKERLESELAKCQVLCKECHRRKTTEQGYREIEHGTRRGYDRGCRCPGCTLAKVEANKLYKS